MAVALIATLTISTIIAVSMESRPNMSEIGEAAKAHRNLFYVYILLVAATVIFSVLVWDSSNKYQDAVKRDADAKIASANAIAEIAKAEAAKANEKISDLTVQAESLRTEAQKAKEEIAIAQVQAAQANAEAAKAAQEAAEANEKAEAERLVRVKLETDLAPRIITTNREVIEELKLFSETKVFIEVEPGDIEANRLAGQIHSMLTMANWNILGVTPKKPSETGFRVDSRGNVIVWGTGGVKIYSKRTEEKERGISFENSHNKWNDAAKILSYQLVDGCYHNIVN
ncbi:MAG: hypothetical protein ABSB32_13530 [Thermodesulfobacteriota bacterium]|jgi:F0F1-type ATP synthase membrane subunit b/b'